MTRPALHANINHCGKNGPDGNSKNIDGLIHSVSAETPDLFQFNDSETQIFIMTYFNFEV